MPFKMLRFLDTSNFSFFLLACFLALFIAISFFPLVYLFLSCFLTFSSLFLYSQKSISVQSAHVTVPGEFSSWVIWVIFWSLYIVSKFLSVLNSYFFFMFSWIIRLPDACIVYSEKQSFHVPKSLFEITASLSFSLNLGCYFFSCVSS